MPCIDSSASEVSPSGYEVSLPQCVSAGREVGLVVNLLSPYGSRAPSNWCLHCLKFDSWGTTINLGDALENH